MYRALIQMATGAGKTFTETQTAWLQLIRDHITTSFRFEREDLKYAPSTHKAA